MEKSPKISDELLLDYIDGHLDDSQRAMVEKACEGPEWKSRLEELQQVNRLLSLEEVTEPSKNFSAWVMSDLESPLQASPYVKKSGIILLIFTLCTVVLGSIYMTEGSITFEFIDSIGPGKFNGIFNVSEITLPDTVNLKWLTDGLLFILLMASLLLFDRMILRPFFRNRKTEIHY